MDWELVLQKKQKQTNKYTIHKNNKSVDHNYKVRNKLILDNNDYFKYEIMYKGPFDIKQCCTNVKVKLNYDATKIRYNIHLIKSYTSDTNVEYIKP